MNIKAGFRSVDRLDLSALAVGAVLCAVGMATVDGWPADHAVSTSIAGFIVAIPIMAVHRAINT